MYEDSIYQTDEEFVLRSRWRRLTFGYSMYSKERISLWSRARLIWQAYFSSLGGKKRYDAYFNTYLDRFKATQLRKIRRKRYIGPGSPNYDEALFVTQAEKMMLDHIAKETGKAYIN